MAAWPLGLPGLHVSRVKALDVSCSGVRVLPLEFGVLVVGFRFEGVGLGVLCMGFCWIIWGQIKLRLIVLVLPFGGGT